MALRSDVFLLRWNEGAAFPEARSRELEDASVIRRKGLSIFCPRLQRRGAVARPSQKLLPRSSLWLVPSSCVCTDNMPSGSVLGTVGAGSGDARLYA